MKRKQTNSAGEPDGKIVRRDFLNSALLGVGASLLSTPAPAQQPATDASADSWTGYGGVGEYAEANGNTWRVMSSAHKMRDGAYKASSSSSPIDTGERFDVIVVGGGLSGLGAAYYFSQATNNQRRCLILENHPIFGGECKQNEFLVNGQRLIGPQGSNDFVVPPEGSGTLMDRIFADLHLPREYAYQRWNDDLKPIRFPLDNYANLDGLNDTQVDIGYFFDKPTGAPKPAWISNIFSNNLADTPFPEQAKRDLLKWRLTTGATEQEKRYLDTITYKDYLERVMGYSPEVTKFVEPFIGLITGVSPDAVAARVGHGFVEPVTASIDLSFPGGNTTFARHLVRSLIPDSLPGDYTFENVLNKPLRFAALDKPGSPTRIRLRATVIRVEHERPESTAGDVLVTYEQGGKLYRAKARGVVMASGGWVNKYVIADLPNDLRAAYEQFHYAPALIVNVALTNWRFLYKLGVPACRWFDGEFGFTCNIRRSMVAGSYQPPLHPDKPTVLTFYLGLYTPGKSASEQGVLGRTKLLATSYADYEKQICSQMTKLFSGTGFDASKDIAGVVLNRWGHARVIQPPGFYYGLNGKPAPREIVQNGFGRIAIGHSELNGHQNVTGAFQQGQRASQQILALI